MIKQKADLLKALNIETCNGCRSLVFGSKKCLKLDRQLDTYQNAEGYIAVIRPKDCEKACSSL